MCCLLARNIKIKVVNVPTINDVSKFLYSIYTTYKIEMQRSFKTKSLHAFKLSTQKNRSNINVENQQIKNKSICNKMGNICYRICSWDILFSLSLTKNTMGLNFTLKKLTLQFYSKHFQSFWGQQKQHIILFPGDIIKLCETIWMLSCHRFLKIVDMSV